MRVLRSSFGLLGVVHEVVLRVQPLTPVKIDYQMLTLKEFGARFAGIVEAPGALRLHISPFNDRITVERRNARRDRRASAAPASGRFAIRDAQRAARVRLDGRQRAGGARVARGGGLGDAARAARDARPRDAQAW